MEKKQSFIEWNSNIFASSMKKIDLNILLIVTLDALFYLLSGYLIIFWLGRIQAKMAAFSMPSDIASMGYERGQQMIGEIKAFYYLIVLSLVLVLITLILLASIFKGIIWAKTAKTKISFSLISKFLGLNLIWMGFWLVVVFLLSYLVKPASAPIFMAIALVFGFYFTNILYALFMKENKIKDIFHAVKLGTAKIHLFLLPYAFIAGILLIIAVFSGFTNFNSIMFSAAVKMGDLIGADYSGILARPLEGFAVDPRISVIAITSILINPFFLLLFAAARYYMRTLALEIKMTK